MRDRGFARTLGQLAWATTPDPKPLVALTFDDGPSARHTPAIVDELDRLGVGASFFLVGREAVVRPALVREIADRGHAVGQHTWDHAPLDVLDDRGFAEQVVRATGVI